MSNAPESHTPSVEPPSGWRIAVAAAALFGCFGGLLFGAAGRLDWVAGWVYLAIVMANMSANLLYLRRVNPTLIVYRSRFGKGTKRWDVVWLAVGSPIFLAVYLIAGLDAGRFGWSAMPLYLWPVGLAVFLPGTALLSWSMGVNPFFEKTVRIQTERGHRVIDTGPYRVVRHPGYTGFAAWMVSAPLLLGSWWAFVPVTLAVAALVVRTVLEDRTLRAELAGYDAYARRVRYRLVPYVW